MAGQTHPLRRWISRHPEFRVSRDARRAFGCSPAFLWQVLAGLKRPKPSRAYAWERLTGIPAKTFLLYGRRRTDEG